MLGGNTERRIVSNQNKAWANCLLILKALKKWKEADYDANGVEDYPLGPLRRMVETKLVNGEAVALIPGELAGADLRERWHSALDGYNYTLVHPDKPWPENGGMMKEVGIMAMPQKIGSTGACTFFLGTDGGRFFSQCQFIENVPPCPEQKTIEAGIWLPMP